MYVHHGIHDIIFNFVGTLEASQVGVNPSFSHSHGSKLFLSRIVLLSFLHLHKVPDRLFMSSEDGRFAAESCDSILCSDAFQQDAAFNKTSRSLQELQQKDLGVKPQFRSAPQHIFYLGLSYHGALAVVTAPCSNSSFIIFTCCFFAASTCLKQRES